MASRGSSKKGGAVHVISGPLDATLATQEPSSPPVEGRILGQRMNISVGQSSRASVHEGFLLKRCRLSWRERIVEVIRDSTEFSGGKISYQLLIFDPRKRTLKDRIPMEDIVTIRASCDCYFQIFLSNGKILQFRAESMESQAYWMALIKVGLGRGSIFHVRVHTPQKGLEHALLYSIGVNLPAHRVGELDRVLVLASPVNDINIHAWDLNRVKHFMRLDIGIQMELCNSCITSSLQGTSITFVLDKVFHDECIDFLCQEARIGNQPVSKNSLLVYPVNHSCTRPPSYLESQHQSAQIIPWDSNLNRTVTDFHSTNGYTTRDDAKAHMNVAKGAGVCTHTLFQPAVPTVSEENESIPPRNITRRNFESAVPAVAHPYMNFQPQLFEPTFSSSFESPYQISSRIIITNSGEVQYERNILGNDKPKHHGGFHFKSSMPLPPRSTINTTPKPSLCTPKVSPDTPKAYPDAPQVIIPIPRSPNRTGSLPTAQTRREEQRANRRLQKRASELSDSDESYVFIPDVVRDPTRVPLEHDQPPLQGSSLEGSHFPDQPAEGSSHFYVNYFCSPNGHGPPVGGSDSHDPSLNNPSSLQEESISPLPDVCDPSIRSSSQQPQSQVEGVTVPQTPSKKETDGTDSFSGDYDDIVFLTQQFSIRHGKGAVPHVITTQEIRSSDSPVPVRPSYDYVPHHPVLPGKPQVKPRKLKTFSESDFQPHSVPTTTTTTQKSLTIPKPHVSNSDLSRLPCHHTLDTTSQDGDHYSSTSPVMDTPHPHPYLPPTHPPMRPQLQQPSVPTYDSLPLTPPVPRPRPLFSGFAGGARVQRQSVDDSVVGRNRASSSHTHQSRLSSTKFHTPFGPISDV